MLIIATRLIFSVWFFIALGMALGFLSATLFDRTFRIKKMFRLTGFALIWPIALFSEAGRKKLKQTLKEV